MEASLSGCTGCQARLVTPSVCPRNSASCLICSQAVRPGQHKAVQHMLGNVPCAAPARAPPAPLPAGKQHGRAGPQARCRPCCSSRSSLTVQWSSTRVIRTDWSTEPLASRLPSEFHPSVYTCGGQGRASCRGDECWAAGGKWRAEAAVAAEGTFFRCALKLLCFHSDIGASVVIGPHPLARQGPPQSREPLPVAKGSTVMGRC